MKLKIRLHIVYNLLVLLILLTPSLYSQQNQVFKNIKSSNDGWIQLGDNSFYQNLRISDIEETLTDVRNGHQPWRLEPDLVILTYSGIEYTEANKVSIIQRNDNFDFKSYTVKYSGEEYQIDLYKFENIYFPLMISFNNVNVNIQSYNKKIKLSGVLLLLEFAGPPNFEDIYRGDKTETMLVLLVQNPIRINDGNSKEESLIGINELQLAIFGNRKLLDMKNLIGKKIELVGSLYENNNAFHRTKNLIAVNEIGNKI